MYIAYSTSGGTGCQVGGRGERDCKTVRFSSSLHCQGQAYCGRAIVGGWDTIRPPTSLQQAWQSHSGQQNHVLQGRPGGVQGGLGSHPSFHSKGRGQGHEGRGKFVP